MHVYVLTANTPYASQLPTRHSGFTIEVCNHNDECCKSPAFTKLGKFKSQEKTISANQDCKKVVLSKDFDQIPTVRVHHFGPDGTTLHKIAVVLEGRTFEFRCFRARDGTDLAVPGGPNGIFDTHCGGYYFLK